MEGGERKLSEGGGGALRARPASHEVPAEGEGEDGTSPSLEEESKVLGEVFWGSSRGLGGPRRTVSLCKAVPGWGGVLDGGGRGGWCGTAWGEEQHKVRDDFVLVVDGGECVVVTRARGDEEGVHRAVQPSGRAM